MRKFVFIALVFLQCLSLVQAGNNAIKEHFINELVPLIHQENQYIIAQRAWVLEMLKQLPNLSSRDAQQLETLSKTYRIVQFDPVNKQDVEKLLPHLDTVPTSLVLAQAATESGWGQSRFAKQANNLFGQWCMTKGCGLVPLQRQAGKTHEVKRFASFAESIRSYLRNINSHPAYKRLRAYRAELRAQQKPVSSIELSKLLSSYSERGAAYSKQLIQLIRINKLERFDALT